MVSRWRRLVVSSALLLALLIGVAMALGLLGGAVLLPQLGALGWVAVGLGLFLALQLALFRLFGLRSHADDEAEAPGAPSAAEAGEADAPEVDEARDWRAWRG